MRLPTADIVSISELLGRQARYAVPDYQRFYSWEEKEARQLLDDLLAVLDNKDDDETEPYFLGTILLVPRPDAPALAPGRSGNPTFDIVDGAQRITTLTILLSVLRDLARERQQEAATDLDIYVSGKMPELPPILSLRPSDQEFFAQYVQTPGATSLEPNVQQLSASQRRLLEARNLYRFELMHCEARRQEELAAFVLSNGILARITSHGLDAAMQLFMALNARGKPLSTVDILRSMLLDRVPENDKQTCLEIWTMSEISLGDELEALFAHIRSQHEKLRPKLIDATLQVAEEVGGASRYITSWLAPQARALSYVRHGAPPDWSHSQELSCLFDYLCWLKGDADWLPPTLYWMAKHLDSPEEILPVVVEIDRLSYCLRLLNMGARKRQQRLSEVTRAMRLGETIDGRHPAFQLTRDERRILLSNLAQLHRRNAQISKIVLMRLEHAAAAEPRHLPADKLSVEHILPQRPPPGSEWRRLFAEPDTREQYVHSLGNLVLLPTNLNGRAGNLDFSAKKEIFFGNANRMSTPLLMDLEQETEWGPLQIERRELRLLELAQSLWRLQD